MSADRPSRPSRRGGRGGRGGRAEGDCAAEEAVELTVVARQAGVKIVHVRRYLEFGLFEAHGAAAPDSSRFHPSSAARVARAERLRVDLGLNYAGAVLVCELLDRISELQARRSSPN
jgi:MerR HTH family regulatory protein